MKKIAALLLIGLFLTTTAYADEKGSRGVSRSTVKTETISSKGSQQVTKSSVEVTRTPIAQKAATPQTRVVSQQPKAVAVRQAPRQQQEQQQPMAAPRQIASPIVETWDDYPCADCPIQVWASSDYYPTKMGGQFLRGLINAATCWLELPRSIYEGSRDGVPFVGTFVGIGEGTAFTLLRAGGGIFDIVTAIVPNYNNEVYRSEEEPIIFCEYICG